MQWNEILLPALTASNLILLCLVWFMIGKYYGLRKRVAERHPNGADIVEEVGPARREVRLRSDDKMNPEMILQIARAINAVSEVPHAKN